MSSGSLFKEEEKNSSNRIILYVSLISLLIVGIGGFAFYWFNKPKVKSAEVKLDEEIRNSTMAMMAQRRFSGEDFGKQILGKGRLERLSWQTRDAYFTFPKDSQAEFDEFLNKFLVDKNKLEMAKEANGKLALGDYSMRLAPDNPYFFKTNLENIKIDSNQTLNFPYKTVSYTLSLTENNNFLNNSQVYGGKLNADTSQKVDEQSIVFANHGIMVAKPNEPSLIRLTSDILKDETIANNREAKIQRLVDFVSNEIQYDYSEAVGGRETLKRPNEVLLTRSGDCSNKTILLASLLEQIGEDYLLLYCPKHITVAVPQGNFPNENKMDFEWEGKNWLIAETTLAGFQVGKTRVKDFVKITPVSYVQRPKEKNLIFDASSFRALEFR